MFVLTAMAVRQEKVFWKLEMFGRENFVQWVYEENGEKKRWVQRKMWWLFYQTLLPATFLLSPEAEIRSFIIQNWETEKEKLIGSGVAEKAKRAGEGSGGRVIMVLW